MFGNLGSPELYNWSNQFELIENNFTNLSSNFLYHGIDWIYVSVQSINAFDFKVWYFWFSNSVFDESFDFFFFSYWYLNLLKSTFQLFNGVILDLYVNSNLLKLPFTDDWFKTVLSSKELSLIFVYHPELIFVKNELNQNFFYSFLSDLNFSIYNLIDSETFFSPVLLFPQFLFLVFLSVIFIIFYFSFFISYTREENTIDVDYLVSNSTVEAEKEITSFDDMILAFIVLIYMFGWYFYIHCWSILSMMPELVLVFYLFPGLYYVIIGTPTFLIYDFGIFFLAYMKGTGNSSISAVEAVFDYIAVIIFYTRILVQSVRLVLMIFTYASMHDLVMLFSFSQKMFLGAETFWEELNGVSITLDSMSYFFLFTLPGRFIYWIYEILHTFFVVTVQFAAFFAIVFWLFLFLYTFFVIEKQENYFTEKRLFRKKYFNYLINLKN
jgi:hypothetical protein